jgi:hypothetical protein
MPTSPVTPESKKSSTGLPEPRESINLSRNRSYLYVREIGTSGMGKNSRDDGVDRRFRRPRAFSIVRRRCKVIGQPVSVAVDIAALLDGPLAHGQVTSTVAPTIHGSDLVSPITVCKGRGVAASRRMVDG